HEKRKLLYLGLKVFCSFSGMMRNASYMCRKFGTLCDLRQEMVVRLGLSECIQIAVLSHGYFGPRKGFPRGAMAQPTCCMIGFSINIGAGKTGLQVIIR